MPVVSVSYVSLRILNMNYYITDIYDGVNKHNHSNKKSLSFVKYGYNYIRKTYRFYEEKHI